MDMIGRIRRLHVRGKKSEREIARLTGLSRNTIAKWLHAPVEGSPKYRRTEQATKLTAFHETLNTALLADAHRPRHERRTVRALHQQIRADGYEGCYSRVTDFVRAWRLGAGQAASNKAFVPLAFELGEAPVRLERRGAGDRRHLPAHAGLAHEAVRQPGVLARGVPEPGPRDAVRGAHAQLCGARRRRAARHLRQHEDGRRQGQEGQGPGRQRALCGNARALLVRRRHRATKGPPAWPNPPNLSLTLCTRRKDGV